MAALEVSVKSDLKKYVHMARRLGYAADFRTEVATDVVESAFGICRKVAKEYPRSCVFTGQITFDRKSSTTACCTTKPPWPFNVGYNGMVC